MPCDFSGIRKGTNVRQKLKSESLTNSKLKIKKKQILKRHLVASFLDKVCNLYHYRFNDVYKHTCIYCNIFQCNHHHLVEVVTLTQPSFPPPIIAVLVCGIP